MIFYDNHNFFLKAASVSMNTYFEEERTTKKCVFFGQEKNLQKGPKNGICGQLFFQQTGCGLENVDQIGSV